MHDSALSARRLTDRVAVGQTALTRISLLAIVGASGLLETWRLTINGWGNGYYAEAALAASRSWTALLTDAADPSQLVSLDKGPLPDWVLGLSARVFGFSSLSVLLPSVCCAIASVVLLYDAVRRLFGAQAGLLAAAMLALSPVSVMMGRYDNPDALLALLMTAAAWAFVRWLESGKLRHLLLCGLFVGLGFNTKMFEVCLLVPGLAGAWLLVARRDVSRRLRDLAAAGALAACVGLAWYATMTVVPAGSRPSVAESSSNSWAQLILTANGLQRVAGYGGGHPGGNAGLLRLFSSDMAGQAGWLMPLALLGLLMGLRAPAGEPREALRRAGVVMLGAWMVIGFGVFSFSKGVLHSYYTSAIAPAIAALAAVAVVTLARRARASPAARTLLVGALMASAFLSWLILGDTPDFVPWLRWLMLAAALIASFAIHLSSSEAGPRARSLTAVIAACCASVALLGGPLAYSVATDRFGHSGANPAAGPTSLTSPHGRLEGSFDPALVGYLERNRAGARYLIAATGSDFAAPIGLATGAPVITLGGFIGTDVSPTVAQLAALVHSEQLRFVLLTWQPAPGAAAQRADWVEAHCTRVAAPGIDGRTEGENGAPLRGPRSGLYRC